MYRVLILVLLITSLPAISERNVITRSPYYKNPYYTGRNYNQNSWYNTDILSEITDLEEYVFNKNFCSDNNLTRVQRLEEAVFGSVQKGNLYTRFENVKSAALDRPNNKNYKNTLLRNLSNYFNGQMTGYTPNFSYSPLRTNYGNSSYIDYSGPYGRGYRYLDRSTGSSSGVRILD